MSVLSLMQRLMMELRHAPETTSSVESIVVEDGVARIAGDRYRHTASSNARVELLRRAGAQASRIEVHVPIENDRTHVARVFVDGPRRILKKLGRNVAEPGDRFGDGFTHRFFDEEELLSEIDRAGLVFVGRRGETFILERASAAPSREQADRFRLEVARVLLHVALADRARRRDTPEEAVGAMRSRGGAAPRRGPIGRARLRRAISWVDALFPTGPSCYRRILLELALDGHAARETIVFGLDVGRTGHVAFKDTEDRTFDVAYEIEG